MSDEVHNHISVTVPEGFDAEALAERVRRSLQSERLRVNPTPGQIAFIRRKKAEREAARIRRERAAVARGWALLIAVALGSFAMGVGLGMGL